MQKKRKKRLYPGLRGAEEARRIRREETNEEPDFICGAPNYEKFKGISPEKVLVMLNID